MYDNMYIQEKQMGYNVCERIDQARQARLVKEAKLAQQNEKTAKPQQSRTFFGRLLHRPGF
jgi:hypothetical protein